MIITMMRFLLMQKESGGDGGDNDAGDTTVYARRSVVPNAYGYGQHTENALNKLDL